MLSLLTCLSLYYFCYGILKLSIIVGFFPPLISIAVRTNFHLKFHFKLIFKHDYAQPSPS